MVDGSPGTPASSITKTGRRDIAESGVKKTNKNSSQTILMFITLSQSQHVISLLDRQKHFISSTR